MPHSFTHFFAPLYILKLETHNGSPLPFSPRRTLFILIIIPYTGIFRKYIIMMYIPPWNLGREVSGSPVFSTQQNCHGWVIIYVFQAARNSFHSIFRNFRKYIMMMYVYLLGLYAAKSHRLSNFLHPNKIVTVELLFFKCFSQKKPASAAHKFCYFTTIDPVNGQRVAPFSMTMMCDEWWLSVFWLND